MEQNQNYQDPPVIFCDACGEPKLHADICFVMGGCSHLPYFDCLTLRRMADDDDHSAGFRCPVPNCANGFLFQQRFQEALEERAQELELHRALQEEEEERVQELELQRTLEQEGEERVQELELQRMLEQEGEERVQELELQRMLEQEVEERVQELELQRMLEQEGEERVQELELQRMLEQEVEERVQELELQRMLEQEGEERVQELELQRMLEQEVEERVQELELQRMLEQEGEERVQELELQRMLEQEGEERVQQLELRRALEEEEEEEEEEERVQELPPDTFFCSICMEDKLRSEGFIGKSGCDHIFCKDCIAGHVEAKVEENIFPIRCPDPECQIGQLDPDECRGFIPPAVFDRWGLRLCESALAPRVRFYCPFSDCSALLTNEGDEEGGPLTESQCLHCERTCCAQCRVPWHAGLTCEEYRKAVAEEREENELGKLMELALRRRWQKCPMCGMLVERIDGCLFIRCRCNHCFCYRCASTMDETHFCQKCRLTWDREN